MANHIPAKPRRPNSRAPRFCGVKKKRPQREGQAGAVFFHAVADRRLPQTNGLLGLKEWTNEKPIPPSARMIGANSGSGNNACESRRNKLPLCPDAIEGLKGTLAGPH
ncbi:hypothetical protein WDM22_03725 [Bradyrhizobium septentrionale]|nr:hypothetical protein [Bradyrhizobium septentrionale]UGY19341.1 hypothetical protein HAP48_0018910 [Bradyrhizobium septentrionale]UGY28071.1 hypothetical protein HU675_0015645 [Bradyrhizobium septentrionale]